jgi:AraC family transcriptional activator of tynA and feaB
VSQDGRTAHIGPREMFFIDTARPFTIDTSTMQCLSLYLSGAQLRSVLPDLDQFTATAISARPGAGALFATTLEGIYRNVAHIDDASARRVAAALPHLLGAALAAQAGAPARIAAHAPAEQLAHIRAFAIEHLADPDLSCEMIADGVALSTRRLHQLFARESETLMKWLWRTRLERCRADLHAPALRERTIADIAVRWGFADPAHFSRAFKLAFGQSPRAFRRQLLSLSLSRPPC